MNMKPWMNAGLGLSLLSASIAFAAQNDDKNFGLDVKTRA